MDVVFLSEGYTSSQLARFLTDATNAFQRLLIQPPFASYKSYFNASAIFVASQQSGSDHLGVARNTYFNSSYDAISDFIITIPQTTQGQGKVDALIQQHQPGADCIVLLVNDLQPGGSDGFGQLAIASVAASSANILAHEIGHVLAGLGDEYDAPYPGFPDVEEPNTTRETRRDFIKWKDWIAPSTPVPTPPSFEYEQAVGLFEGAHYHSTGWFRPKFDCKMNHYSVPFCEVCSEALVLGFYKKVRPIDSFTPATSLVTVQGSQPLTFAVQLLAPEPNTLHIQWTTNGSPVEGATNSTLTLSSGTLSSGSNGVTASVFDATPLVRSDPENLRLQTVNWTVTADRTELRLEEPMLLSDGAFVVKVTGASANTILQTSQDLAQWVPCWTNPPAATSFYYTNPPSPGSAQQFLRAVTP